MDIMQSETDKAFLPSLLPPLAYMLKITRLSFLNNLLPTIFKIHIKKLEMLLANYNLSPTLVRLAGS